MLTQLRSLLIRLKKAKLNIVCGILSAPSWLLPSWVVLKTFTLDLAQNCSISVQPLEPPFPIAQTLLAQ